MDMKGFFTKNKNIFPVLLGVMIGVLMSYLIVTIFLKPPLLTSHYVWVDQMGSSDVNTYVHELVVKGKILSASDIYGSLVSYFNTLITILLACLGLLSIVAYFYSRGISMEWADEQISKRFDAQSKSFFDLLEVKVEKQVGNLVDEQLDDSREGVADELKEMSAKLEKLEEELETIRSAPGSKDLRNMLALTSLQNGNNKEKSI